MPVAERTLTEFLQHSGRVLPEVERGEVVLRRRDGDSLVLISQSHWEALAKSFTAVAEAARDLESRCQCPPAPRTGEFALSWLSLLSEQEQRECLRELSQALVAALADGKFESLVNTLAQWRATALATWDDAQKPTGYWEGAPLDVERP
ncbi:MAG: hypothetical protein M1401_05085 [Chloroflexi bacterium]|nr:hypothetical protein [Chloroflexota bacterium]